MFEWILIVASGIFIVSSVTLLQICKLHLDKAAKLLKRGDDQLEEMRKRAHEIYLAEIKIRELRHAMNEEDK